MSKQWLQQSNYWIIFICRLSSSRSRLLRMNIGLTAMIKWAWTAMQFFYNNECKSIREKNYFVNKIYQQINTICVCIVVLHSIFFLISEWFENLKMYFFTIFLCYRKFKDFFSDLNEGLERGWFSLSLFPFIFSHIHFPSRKKEIS